MRAFVLLIRQKYVANKENCLHTAFIEFMIEPLHELGALFSAQRVHCLIGYFHYKLAHKIIQDLIINSKIDVNIILHDNHLPTFIYVRKMISTKNIFNYLI